MEEIPPGTVPPLESFLLKVRGPHEILLADEDSIYLVTGAINQGLDSDLISIGAEGRWLSKHGLSVVIRDGKSLYTLIKRLIDIETSHPHEFGGASAALAHDILNHFGYSWPEVVEVQNQEEPDGEGEGEGSFIQEEER